MTGLEFAELLLKVATEVGPASAKALEQAARDERPDLVATPPPERQDTAIEAEDEELIRKKFPR